MACNKLLWDVRIEGFVPPALFQEPPSGRYNRGLLNSVSFICPSPMDIGVKILITELMPSASHRGACRISPGTFRSGSG